MCMAINYFSFLNEQVKDQDTNWGKDATQSYRSFEACFQQVEWMVNSLKHYVSNEIIERRLIPQLFYGNEMDPVTSTILRELPEMNGILFN